MRFEGGCYCGKLRYLAEGEPRLRAQCHCRPCQYISGGGPNLFMLMPPEGFRYVSGAPKSFKREDLEAPVTREFCEACGTHIATLRPGLPFVILKIGSLDDPSLYGGAQMAINTADKQPFHIIPEGVPASRGPAAALARPPAGSWAPQRPAAFPPYSAGEHSRSWRPNP
jgi:hypothetical protein